MPPKKKHLPQRKRKTVKARTPARRSPKAGVKARLQTVALYRAQQKVRDQVEKDRDQKFEKFLAQTEKPAEPAGPEFALRAIAAAPGKQNLRSLAESDSWFEYPLPVNHRDGVIYQLVKLLGYAS